MIMPGSTNTHVGAYLAEYLKRPALFAVLVSGQWGAGKTYTVSEYLKGRSVSHIYVSVNGVRDTSEVRRRLVYAAYPLLADKTMQTIGSLAKSAAGVFRFKTDLQASDLVEIDKVKVIIIDDLERAQMPIEELLGFLNDFVEHDKKHLILLGNEEELQKKPDFSRIREKTIGFILRVSPDVSGALSSFRQEISKEFNEFLDEHCESLSRVFLETESENLRVLRQTIFESESIFFCAEEIGLDDEGIVEVLTLYLALSVAYKEGRIHRLDLRERNTQDYSRLFRSHTDTYVETPLDKLDKSLKEVDVFSTILDNGFLESKLCDGIDDLVSLKRSLNDLVARSDASKNPEWRNLWYFMRNPDRTTHEALEEFEKAFADRKYEDLGTILHAFGLKIEMARIGLIDRTRADLEQDCRSYIRDLVVGAKLPAVASDPFTSFSHGSAHGLGFMNGEDKLFRRLRAELMHQATSLQRQKVVEALRLAVAEGATDDLTQILVRPDSDINSHSKPILDELDPGDFAHTVLSMDGDVQYLLFGVLGSRYEECPYPDILKKEGPWLRKVQRELKSRIPAGDKLLSFRIKKLIEWNWPAAAKVRPRRKKASVATPSGTSKAEAEAAAE